MTPTFDTLDAASVRIRSQARKAELGGEILAYVW